MNTCSKCDLTNNYGFQTDSNSVTSCVLKNIPNCVTATDSYPFKCTVCAAGYYPNSDGACVSTTVILNCQIYDSATTCTKCVSPYVLSVDRTKCSAVKYVDPNCNDLKLLGTATCSNCLSNFQFVNGVCSRCQITAEGCYNCNYDNSSTCLVCAPGYYMIKENVCKSIITFDQYNANVLVSASGLAIEAGLAKLVTGNTVII